MIIGKIYRFILRHSKLYKFKIYCKKNKCKVIKPLILNNPEYIHFDKCVRIKEGARIECYNKFGDQILSPILSIRENVIIGYNFSCLVADKVEIGKNTILASNVLITSVIILPNVKIGDKCIIAAGSIVTKDIPSYSMAVGIPARVIKKYDFERHEWIAI